MTASSTISSERLGLKELARLGRPRPPAITVLFPPLASSQPADLRLKRAIDEVFHQLLGLQWSPHEVAQLVSPLLALARDPIALDAAGNGMALFVDAADFWCHRVPPAVPEVVRAGCHFYLRPLLDWITEPDQFLLLELSETQLRLRMGCQDQLLMVPLPHGVPSSIEEISTFQRSEGGREGDSRHRGGYGSAISYGMTSGNRERRLQFFFAMVDRALHLYLEEAGLPLVLAGTQHLVSAYRKENTYHNTVPCGIRSNLAELAEDAILTQARRLIRAERRQEATSHLVAMEEYAPGDRWSASIQAILRAAAKGRVWRLFLAEGGCCEGDYNSMIGRSNGHKPFVEDLLNAAAVQTLSQGGEVFLVERSLLPEQACAAALFRYSTDPGSTES